MIADKIRKLLGKPIIRLQIENDYDYGAFKMPQDRFTKLAGCGRFQDFEIRNICCSQTITVDCKLQNLSHHLETKTF